MIPASKRFCSNQSRRNSLAQKGTQHVNCSEDRVAAQWRKSAKIGFSEECGLRATRVPEGFRGALFGKGE